MSEQHVAALKHLRETQKPLIGEGLHKPFLDEPADFQARRAGVSTKHDGTIIALPPLLRDPPVMTLAEVVGDNEVKQILGRNQLVFHALGDTGNSEEHSEQWLVAESMIYDFHRDNAADRPTFCLHLGDVVYDIHYAPDVEKAPMYASQFDAPYKQYPAKILAAAGNHDSNPDEASDAIQAFMAKFCAPLKTQAPHAAASNERKPMHQPGVYYRLDAPFIDIIVLFSNGGEYVGAICENKNIAGSDVLGDTQYNFLVQQLQEIKALREKDKQRKALLIVVHHPPFSGGGGHSGSGDMLNDMDHAFDKAEIVPDAVLAAHSHCYQRFTRIHRDGQEVPYIVSGNGGHNITPLKLSRERTPVRLPLEGTPRPGAARSDHSLRQYFNGYGHMYITATKDQLKFDLIGSHSGKSNPMDSVTVDLQQGKIANETPPFAHPAEGEQEAQHHRSHPVGAGEHHG